MIVARIFVSDAAIVVRLCQIRIEFDSFRVKFYRAGMVAAFSEFKSLVEFLFRQRNFFFLS